MTKTDFMKLFEKQQAGLYYEHNMKMKVVFSNGDTWLFNCSGMCFDYIRKNIRKNLKAVDFKEIKTFSFD